MRVFIYIVSVLLVSLFMGGGVALAQQCNPAYESITTLRKPIVGSYNHWDAEYGEKETLEKFVGGTLNKAGSRAVVVGERRVSEGATPEIVLMEYDRRGRIVWENSHRVDGLEAVREILLLKDGYLVVADQAYGDRRERIWVGFFDFKGQFEREALVDDPTYDLKLGDLMLDPEANGYVLAVSAKKRRGQSMSQTMIYKLDARGKVRFNKTYLPGIESKPFSISVIEDGRYLVAGYIRTDSGRRAGWIAKMEADGRIIWQQQYARGLFSKITRVEEFIDGYFVTFGEAEPSDRKNRAAWVMLLNGETGEIGWQRYYKSNFDLYAQDMITHSDGQISLLINAVNPPKQEEEEYARILTLNPRGLVLLSNTYYNGKGARAADMFLGQNFERVLVGESKVAYIIEDEHDSTLTQTEVSPEGWVVAGVPVEPYDDPCVQEYSFLP